MKGKLLIVSVMAVLIFSGCTTVTPKIDKKIEDSREFKTNFDKAWNATVNAISSSGDVINSLEKDSGVISFNHRNFKDYNEACRLLLLPPRRVCYGIKISANAYVQKVNEQSTSVTIHTQATAICGSTVLFFCQFAGSSELASSGALEKELFDLIEQKIKQDNAVTVKQ